MAAKFRFFKTKYPKKNQSLAPGICVLCGIASDDTYLGQLFVTPEMVVHENCLLFSPLLKQVGNPDRVRTGFIIGFKISDIAREVKRVIPLRCFVCHGPRAGIGCYNTSCRKSFHVSCGFKKGAMAIFKNVFQYYCGKHSLSQDVSKQLKLCDKVVPECTICLESLADEGYDESPEPRVSSNWAQFNAKIQKGTVIQGLCCSRAWMHRACIRNYALSAGLHHSKCPNCGDRKVFNESIQRCGVWLPDRDASWELEPGAFHELYDNPGTSVDETTEDHNISPETAAILEGALVPRVVIVDTVANPNAIAPSPPPASLARKRRRPSNWSSVSSPTKPIKRVRQSTKTKSQRCSKCNKKIVDYDSFDNTARRPPLRPSEVHRAMSMIDAGVTQLKIARLIHCSLNTVSRTKIKIREMMSRGVYVAQSAAEFNECVCLPDDVVAAAAATGEVAGVISVATRGAAAATEAHHRRRRST